MDCHHTLRHRPRSLAGLCDAASGPSTIASVRFAVAIDSRDVDSRGAGQFAVTDSFVFARRNSSGIR